MVRSVRVVQAGAPERWGEDYCRQEEEHAGDFEPEDSSDAAERPQQTADAVRNSASGLINELACWLPYWASRDRGRGARKGRRLRRRGLRTSARGLGSRGNASSDNSPGNADANAKSATNHSRSHSVYDGSSGLRRWRVRNRRAPRGCHGAELAVR